MKIFSIILFFLNTLVFADELHNINEETKVEINNLSNMYDFIAVIKIVNNEKNIEWLREPPADILKSLEPFIEIEAKVAVRQKSNGFVFCSKKDEFSIRSMQIRNGFFRLNELLLSEVDLRAMLEK